VISTSDVTLVPQSFSQRGEQERKEAARAEIRGNPRNLLISESLDMFSYIFSHLPKRNSTAQINSWQQSDVTAWSFWIKLDPFP